LSACGGGSTGSISGTGSGTGSGTSSGSVADLAAADGGALLAASVTTLDVQGADLPPDVAVQMAQPHFHVAPVWLPEPDDSDASGASTSATRAPRVQGVAAGLSRLSTQALSAQAWLDGSSQGLDLLAPLAASGAISTYTPAQVRAAYGFAALPATYTGLSATQAAQLGAGQTIYIIDAQHDPNAADELAAFSAKFGLPACTSKPIATTASLPLASASSNGCEWSVVYATSSGGMAATAPAYHAAWATEIALDLQWAHASAPLARLVLIEAPSASLNDLLAAVKLANSMGPGVVSMSFGSSEVAGMASADSSFSASDMSYVAAAGDSGAGVSWPAVSPKVLAVGGTSLNWSGSGSRTETAWSGTGGGISVYTAAPSYQSSAVPGLGSLAYRSVNDVAFNANPATGQYVAVMTPGSSAVNWVSAGGTSLATPQWAGLLALANANRALNGMAALGQPHALLYTQIATVPGSYASGFADVSVGSNGSCSTCTAHSGYDQATGLGSPNVSSLVSSLGRLSVTALAPVVTAARISGVTSSTLSFTLNVQASNPASYSLTGAPAGMVVSSSGIVTWANPVAGSYSVMATATDTSTGRSGQAMYGITLSAPMAPVGTNASLIGHVGKALSFATAFTAPNALTYAISGNPTGMYISSAGVVSWASPVAGTYSLTVTASDSQTQLNGQAVYTVKISSSAATTTDVGPVIDAPALTGVAAQALSGHITVTDPGVSHVAVGIAGAPLGMSFSASALALTLNWPSPVAGSYRLSVAVLDSAGRRATATLPITVTAK